MNQYFVTLLRHAESEANAEGVIQGQNDSPLSARGCAQAQALGDYWAKELRGFDQILASPLARARQTAEFVAAPLGLEVKFDPIWMERDFGALAGTRSGTLDAWLAAQDLVHPYLPVGDGGESINDLYLRGGQAVQRLLKNPPGDYLVVAHGGILNMVLYAILGITPMPNFLGPRFKFRNTAHTTLTYTPARHQWRVVGVNERPHWEQE